MSTTHPTRQGPTLAQAALIGGLGMLIMSGTPYAEFGVYAKMVVPDDPAATIANIQAQPGRFLTALMLFLLTFVGDVIVAWAFYLLLAPVNRALSLLTAWFRIVYTVIAIVGVLKLATVYQWATGANYASSLSPEVLQGQVTLLLGSFRYEWMLGLVLFGIHLVLLGYLVFRSGYIPRILGILLAVAGLGYACHYLGPYLFPGLNLRWVMILFFGELIWMLWLLIRGWKIEEPVAEQK
jgi:hypothetical protein